MITFRFHVVSITAIFLAIAIGVVVGSTYVDGAVVDGLKNRIRTVEGNVTKARDENAQLDAAIDERNEYIDVSAQYAVTDRLTEVPVLVVATRGIDEAPVQRTVDLARTAGGSVPGVLWVEPQWATEDQDDLEALAAIVGGAADDAPEDLWADAWQAVVEELSDTGSSEGVAGEEAGATGPLAELVAAGFLTLDPVDDDSVALSALAGVGPRMVLVTGARAQDEVAPVVPVVAEASVAGGLVTVVADVHVVAPEASGRGADLREDLDEALRDELVIVDDADLEAGRVATVLALDSAADGQVGVHYGYGDGADAVLPGWTPP